GYRFDEFSRLCRSKYRRFRELRTKKNQCNHNPLFVPTRHIKPEGFMRHIEHITCCASSKLLKNSRSGFCKPKFQHTHVRRRDALKSELPGRAPTGARPVDKWWR